MEDICRRRAEALNHYRTEYETKKQHQNGGQHAVDCDDSAIMDTRTDSYGYDTVDLGCGISYPPISRDKLHHDVVNSSVMMVPDCESEPTSFCEDTLSLTKQKLNCCDHPAVLPSQISLLQSDSSEGTFECPSCGRTFAVSKPDEFLQHTEGCL